MSPEMHYQVAVMATGVRTHLTSEREKKIFFLLKYIHIFSDVIDVTNVSY